MGSLVLLMYLPQAKLDDWDKNLSRSNTTLVGKIEPDHLLPIFTWYKDGLGTSQQIPESWLASAEY